jgi:hypothetical protein
MSEELWERLVEALQYDMECEDYTAIYELLDQLPLNTILKYLAED